MELVVENFVARTDKSIYYLTVNLVKGFFNRSSDAFGNRRKTDHSLPAIRVRKHSRVALIVCCPEKLSSAGVTKR